jgi:hypothetical protein
MTEPKNPLSADDRRFLAAIVHQVWRSCQAFVAVAMEQGPGEARAALDDLGAWAVTQHGRLSVRRTRAVSALGVRIGREMLEDIQRICRRLGPVMAGLERGRHGNEAAEEEALRIIESVVTWTSLMAAQLGLTRHLRPQMLWFDR